MWQNSAQEILSLALARNLFKILKTIKRPKDHFLKIRNLFAEI